MKKIFESYLGLVILIACVAIVIIVWYIIQQKDGSWLEVLYWFSLSFISAFIFYIVTDYFPTRNKRHAESYEALEIIGKIEKLNVDLLNDLGVHDLILSSDDLVKKEIIFKFVERCTKLQFLDKPEPIFPYKKTNFDNSSDWIEYFTKFEEEESKYFKELEARVDLHPEVRNYLFFSSNGFRMMIRSYKGYKESNYFEENLFPNQLRYISSYAPVIYGHIQDMYNLQNIYKSTLNLI